MLADIPINQPLLLYNKNKISLLLFLFFYIQYTIRYCIILYYIYPKSFPFIHQQLSFSPETGSGEMNLVSRFINGGFSEMWDGRIEDSYRKLVTVGKKYMYSFSAYILSNPSLFYRSIFPSSSLGTWSISRGGYVSDIDIYIYICSFVYPPNNLSSRWSSKPVGHLNSGKPGGILRDERVISDRYPMFMNTITTSNDYIV